MLSFIAVCMTLGTLGKHEISATFSEVHEMLSCKRIKCSIFSALMLLVISLFIFVVVVSLYVYLLCLSKTVILLEILHVQI